MTLPSCPLSLSFLLQKISKICLLCLSTKKSFWVLLWKFSPPFPCVATYIRHDTFPFGLMSSSAVLGTGTSFKKVSGWTSSTGSFPLHTMRRIISAPAENQPSYVTLWIPWLPRGYWTKFNKIPYVSTPSPSPLAFSTQDLGNFAFAGTAQDGSILC